MVVAYVSLGLVGYLVYRLGSLWFDRSIGAVAAAIVLTRAPFLSNGLRAYVDLPYIALCLGALVIETKTPPSRLARPGPPRPRRPTPPEAWLFSASPICALPRQFGRAQGRPQKASEGAPRTGGYSKTRPN